MFVFEPNTEFIKRTPVFITQTSAVAKAVLRDHAVDPTTIEAIAAYYNMLYALQDERNFDVREIVQYLDRGANRIDFDFRTAAENFKLIDQNSVSIIIPFDDTARELVERLPFVLYPVRILRQLQVYTVNIYEREFENLQSKGVIQTISDTYHVLDETCMNAWYDPETGLTLADSPGGDAIFFDG
jgi:CRISPR-associated endonuclease/helicase Cas3